MDMKYTDLADGIRKIDLTGRLDIEGANAIDLPFTALTSTQCCFVVVDLEGVEFLASIGIATLVRNAKALRLREGYMVLMNPRANVAKVLATTRIDSVLPVFQSLEEARQALRAGPSPL